jgi:hypothetical protein
MQPKAPENGFTFIDSEQKAKDNPVTWGHPGPEALRRIEVGCYVKIGVSQAGLSGERFWGVVKQRIGQEFFVQIDQDLRLSDEHGLRDKDIVLVQEKHIFGIADSSGTMIWEP